jgi:DNA polymerase IV
VTSVPRSRSILHLDLDPFFVSVERSLDPALRGKPVIVGGDGAIGIVAAASAEARERGVRPGQPLASARRLCPDAVFRPGDLETYARFSDDVTAILLAASRRFERPSSDEAYVDLTPDGPSAAAPVQAAERIKDEIQRRLGLDASLGVASSRLAARVASGWARPRGLLVVLPGYEASFLARQPVSCLPDLPPHLEAALEAAGFATLGQLLEAGEDALVAAVGSAAPLLRAAARGAGEEPVAVAAPPSSIQEETAIRSIRNDRTALEAILDGLADRASRRIRPFGLRAGSVSVEVRRSEGPLRRTEVFSPGVTDETARDVVRSLAGPLLEPPSGVRGLQVRLGRLASPRPQVPLFPSILGKPAG